MEISSISGPDIVTSHFSVSPPESENALLSEKNSDNHYSRIPDETRGQVIDTYA